jgi:hypothetical protein
MTQSGLQRLLDQSPSVITGRKSSPQAKRDRSLLFHPKDGHRRSKDP